MTSRPRVLHVYKDYYPVLGGVETTIHLLARGTRDEFDVSVLVCSGDLHSSEEMIDGVHVVRVGEWGRLASAPISPEFPIALRREAAHADILHFHHPNPTGDIACLLVKPRAPLVMTYHSDVVRQKRMMRVYGPIQERMMRRCSVIMPTSPNYLESSEWLQRHRDRCQIVPLGIDLERFTRTEEIARDAQACRANVTGPVTMFVGRLRYYKGLEYLVRAMPEVPGLLWIGGTGPEQLNLEGVVNELGLQDRVVFLGNLVERELVVRLHAADVFCMPSHLRSEAFGLSQIEAMACALPVVSTSVASGVPFVNKHDVSGLTVEPENIRALGDALRLLHSDTDLRKRLGQGAFERAHSLFGMERMCENVKAVYRQVLESRPANVE